MVNYRTFVCINTVVAVRLESTPEMPMSLEELRVSEREQPGRYQHARGVITMMTGGSAAHVAIDRAE